MNGFDLSTISSIYVGSTLYSLIYIGSNKLWPIQTTLPYDAEIQYLESTGTQWIDTLIHPTTGYGFELYGGFTTFQNAEFFGGGNNWSNGLGICTHSENTYGIIVGTTEVCTISADNNVMHLFKVNTDGTVYVDNEYKGQSTTVMPDGSYTMNIFRHSNTRVPLQEKIYYVKIYNSTRLLFDGVPVRVGLVGYMYDRVTKTLFGNAGSGNFVLGPDIIEVEYLESTGTQYIDTNKIYNGSYRFEVKFLCNSMASPDDNNSASIFGSRQGPTDFTFQLSTFRNGCFAYYNSLNDQIGLTTGIEYVVEFRQDNKLYINDVEKLSFNNTSFSSPSSILLFALHQNSTIVERFIGKIYYFKLYDINNNNNVILDLIPVRVGQIGYMYDKVSGLLYGNDGTGNFILGRDKLPTGYTELKYISSSSGGNQYIDLGIKLYETLNTNYDIAMKFNIASGNANQAAIFSCQDSDNDPWPGTFVRANSGTSKVVGRYIGGTAKDNTLGNIGADIELQVQTSPNKNVTSLNNNNTTHQYGTSLFCAFVGGTNTPARYCNAKLYYFKLFVGGTLVRDLIPCKNSNNVVGMYDLINNVFYTPPNGAAFVAGQEINIPYDAEIEYIQSNGTQYINTGIDATSVYGLEFKFIPISGNSDTWTSILSGVLDNFTMGYANSSYDSVYIRYRGDEVMRPTISTSSYNTLLLSGNTLSLAGTSVNVTTPIATSSGNLMIANNSAISRYSKVRFSTLKIYGSNNTLLRDFIPVRVGQVGYLYDKVSGQLFANAGTGNFTLGPDIT